MELGDSLDPSLQSITGNVAELTRPEAYSYEVQGRKSETSRPKAEKCTTSGKIS